MKRTVFLEEQGMGSIMDVVVKADDVEMPEPRDRLLANAQLAAEFPKEARRHIWSFPVDALENRFSSQVIPGTRENVR